MLGRSLKFYIILSNKKIVKIFGVQKYWVENQFYYSFPLSFFLHVFKGEAKRGKNNQFFCTFVDPQRDNEYSK